MIRPAARLLSALALALLVSTNAAAQADDRGLVLAEPDFTLVNLPTSLRLPQFGGTFRITHRFVRPLSCDTCPNNLLEDLFGIDNGAAIGLEFRFGLVPNGQVVFHRARIDKSIQLMGEYSFTRQDTAPLELAGIVSVEGTNNFRDVYSPAVGLIATRMFAEAGAVYVEPIWVGNSNLVDNAPGDDSTFMLGLGGRARIRPTVYLVGELSPRLAGYSPGAMLGSFGIEKRAGGHVFQLNFSNYFGTTLRQLAQGALNGEDWYLGFNISRKFF